ncbi:hypothetical protein CDD82_5459 [Ophiocordyceps australis]|uniref:SH3 domain-containing protein n=1 Tax=Ophiocordyceps australis TaxID=1399860 RepID=A0A2C5Z0U4_9HYPO|nr:hypothetical protein CDD82_5459 [Ophiocordyceps australis]
MSHRPSAAIELMLGRSGPRAFKTRLYLCANHAYGNDRSSSVANNFWGKDDAGVGPLLERMHGAKQTCDELKSFYNARAAIEDEYARKLLHLCRKALGTQEMGSLRNSLDTVRGEVESMAKQHQSIATQMKTELEEPLAAFAGGMKERRKIVQNSIEKLLKTKTLQTQHVNKTRDKYEQECLKIKGYLAQGHMVMGQEERRNKAKLEKTQISLASANTEYENAVKALEDTTARWNREWKAAADKFQDLEEERLDFSKSSLWAFANISSTVCVSDDGSCEKIRLSLEKMEVEGDIATFISERGTGQEIPDAPKYINFCRGDVNDNQSEASEDDNYSVAQFPRSINPAFRSSSPQPSTFESHHDPNSALANDLAHRDLLPCMTPQTPQKTQPGMRASADKGYVSQGSGGAPYDRAQQHTLVAAVPHDPYPMDGMTMLCRTAPVSDASGQQASTRPLSQDAQGDRAMVTPNSSQEALGGSSRQGTTASFGTDKRVNKKKSGFFQNHSPFRRKSVKEVQGAGGAGRNTWHASSSAKAPRGAGASSWSQGEGERTASPEPIDANASLALGVGQNVLPVSTGDMARRTARGGVDERDPIAVALAELKDVSLNKQSSVRMSADHYHGISTPVPGSDTNKTWPSVPVAGSHEAAAASRGTPPPCYQQPAQVTRLGVPPPAVTSKAMKDATKKVTEQTRTIFGSRADAPVPGPARSKDIPRAASPAPARSVSPQPRPSDRRASSHRSASPSPYGGQARASPQTNLGSQRGADQGYYASASPNGSSRGVSPSHYRDYMRPQSSYGGGDMAVQLAPVGDDGYGSQRSRASGTMGLYDGASRPRSKSVADPARQYSRDGRPILHFARALYLYHAVIPEELGFNKGDYLAVFRHQDDGWWEAEVHGGNGRVGLVPSNYLQSC